jgi:hypothetical protein
VIVLDQNTATKKDLTPFFSKFSVLFKNPKKIVENSSIILTKVDKKKNL